MARHLELRRINEANPLGSAASRILARRMSVLVACEPYERALRQERVCSSRSSSNLLFYNLVGQSMESVGVGVVRGGVGVDVGSDGDEHFCDAGLSLLCDVVHGSAGR